MQAAYFPIALARGVPLLHRTIKGTNATRRGIVAQVDFDWYPKRQLSSLDIKRAARRIVLPRPHRDASVCFESQPLVVAGMFRTANGLGQSARACFQALKSSGLDPVAVDLSETLNQVDYETSDALSSMPRASRGTLILHANAPETEAALTALGLRRWHDWRIVGYWAWELTQAPESWLRLTRHLSEIWTPSQFVTDAFREKVDIPVRTVPHFVTTPERLNTERQGGDELRCLVMADGRSSFHRKNVVGAVSMFRHAFDCGENATLTLKFRNLREYPEFSNTLRAIIKDDERVTIVDENLDQTDKWNLINDSDILISAHRSEGFGLHMAEAMASGSCVIATGWSGNMEYMNEHNSILLPYRLQPASDPYRVYQSVTDAEWAEVETEAGIEALRALADCPDRRLTIGDAARRSVRATLTTDPYISALQNKPQGDIRP
ncbi:MAG: glycosyltransferase [Pseudomonadota bacterium]